MWVGGWVGGSGRGAQAAPPPPPGNGKPWPGWAAQAVGISIFSVTQHSLGPCLVAMQECESAGMHLRCYICLRTRRIGLSLCMCTTRTPPPESPYVEPHRPELKGNFF